MTDRSETRPPHRDVSRPSRLPDACNEQIQRLFAETPSERWHLSFQTFFAALSQGAIKCFGEKTPSRERVAEYLATLHARDLAMACACADGSENAWNDFIAEFRNYLHVAAGAILRRSPEDPAAIELADSLFADLYGISGGKAGGRSLFRYFHGRSSLKTWLRAVLAQRHIDAIRSGKKFDSLDETEPGGGHRAVRELSIVMPPADPHRETLLTRFREALALALAELAKKDRLRLQLYYLDDCTLAEIGGEIGEHESSVSRNLERVRKELRATVEGILRAGNPAANGGPAVDGMDDAQLDQCFQFAAEDSGIDLDQLFAARRAGKSVRTDRESGPREER
jgi:RNA polymerase sigma-70 factor (ECF subfamily)